MVRRLGPSGYFTSTENALYNQLVIDPQVLSTTLLLSFSVELNSKKYNLTRIVSAMFESIKNNNRYYKYV
jgi:hypothetical protein